MRRKWLSALTLFSLFVHAASAQPAVVEVVPSAVLPALDAAPLLPSAERDYTFGYWLNGMRKHADDQSADVLCLETGTFGFALDLADLTKARLGTFAQSIDYSAALAAGAERMEQLQSTELAIELESKGTVFRAVTCKAGQGNSSGGKHLQDAWLWESGRLAQHYELHGLRFEDAQGRQLGVDGSLSLFAWPQSLSLTADLAPSLIYTEGWHQGAVKNGLCVLEKPWQVPHDARLENAEMTVECWVKIPESMQSAGDGYLLAKNGHMGSHGHYSFKIRKGKVSANMNIAPGEEGRRSIGQRGASFKEHAWNHLAMTYDGKAMHFYVNGKLQGTEVVNLERRPGKGQLVLGQRADGKGAITKAVYDQVRVWNRSLSQQELQAHAKAPESLPNATGLKYNETFDGYGADEVSGSRVERCHGAAASGRGCGRTTGRRSVAARQKTAVQFNLSVRAGCRRSAAGGVDQSQCAAGCALSG